MLKSNKFIKGILAAASLGAPSASLGQDINVGSITSSNQTGGVTGLVVNMGEVPHKRSSVVQPNCNVTTYNQTGGQTAVVVTVSPDGRVNVDDSACDKKPPVPMHRPAHRTRRHDSCSFTNINLVKRGLLNGIKVFIKFN